MPPARIKLLIAIIDLYGGTGTFCRNLAAGLRRDYADEFEISILLINGRGVLPEDNTLFDHIHLLNNPVHIDWRRFPETLLHAWRLRRAIRGIEADVILTVGNYMNLLVPHVAPGRKTLVSVHAMLSEQLKSSSFATIIGELARHQYPRRHVIAPSTGVLKDLQEHYGVRGGTVIPHGVDIADIQRQANMPADDLPKGPYLLACGRLSIQKDYGTLLRAYALAAEAGMKELLVIIGKGEEEAHVRALGRELKLDGRVHLLGYRVNPYPYMKHARGLVLSSIWEGFGLVLLEAMALGIPCISTNCPAGPAEILENGESGILVPTRNPAAMAHAMLQLTGSEALHASLSEKSHRRAARLDLSTMVRAYRELFLENSWSRK